MLALKVEVLRRLFSLKGCGQYTLYPGFSLHGDT